MPVVRLVAFILMTAFPSTLLASDRDPWFGRDKALHFSLSAALALSGYGACRLLESNIPAWLCGGALAVSAGLAKEGIDFLGYGHPSWRDLAWDGIGTATGLGVALGIEVLWRYQLVPPYHVKTTIISRGDYLSKYVVFP